MRCPSCQTENTEDSRCCMTCGGRLEEEPVGSAADDAVEESTEVSAAASAGGESRDDGSGSGENGSGEPSIDLPPPPPPPSEVGEEPAVAEAGGPVVPTIDLPSPPPPVPVVEPEATGAGAPESKAAAAQAAEPEVVEPEVVGDDGGPVAGPDVDVAPEAPAPAVAEVATSTIEIPPEDPHGIAPVLAGLSNGTSALAESVMLVISSVLEEDEQIDRVAIGRVDGLPGLAVLTQRRVILANDRRWKPHVRTVAINPRLMVQGWQDEDTAQLTFQGGGAAGQIDGIADRQEAFDMALRIRVRVSEMGGPSVP